MVRPKFRTEFQEAVVREVADELTLRANEEGALRTFVDTTNVGDKKDGENCWWMSIGTPRPFSRDRNGRPCTASVWNCTKRSNVRNRKKGQGTLVSEDKDLGNVQKVHTISQVRVALWAIHLKSPSAALEKDLGGLEQVESATSVPKEC